MPARSREQYTTTIYVEKEFGPVDDRQPPVVEGDSRDPDLVLRIDGLRVYSRDEKFRSHQGAVEPDWKLGTYLMTDSGQVVAELGPDPAPIFKQCLLQGRVLKGIICAEDKQRHG